MERTDQIIELISKEQGLEMKNFTKEAMKKLDNYSWTGNIRELRNVVERLMILGDNPITAENITQFTPK